MIPSRIIIDEPEQGTWVADLTTTETPDGTFELGGRTWYGSVIAPGSVQDGGQWNARIAGGRGKLNEPIRARNYASTIGYEQLARDIISDAGEQAGSVSIGKRAPYYDRHEMNAGRALTQLCEAAGVIWWVSRDGLVNVAPARVATAVDQQRAPQLKAGVQTATLSVLTADDVAPGMSIGERIIRSVQWSMSHKLNAECSFIDIDIPDVSVGLDYTSVYKAKVSAQNADGSIDCFVDGRFKVARCELLTGLPGTRVEVKAGETVSVGWYGHRPSSPYAMGFSQTLEAAIRFALVGDGTESVLPPFSFQGLVGVPPAGTPIAGVMYALIPKLLGTVTGPGNERTRAK
jgi:hypothetical protein